MALRPYIVDVISVVVIEPVVVLFQLGESEWMLAGDEDIVQN